MHTALLKLHEASGDAIHRSNRRITMGGQSSKPQQGLTPLERAVIDRAKSIQLEDDYVDLVDEKAEYESGCRISRDAEALDPQSTNLLIQESLRDPKNK